MDALDLAILREIGIEPFAGGSRAAHPWRPETLAPLVRSTPRLVKDRVARLEREGIVAGYDVHPNASLLGLEERTYAFAYAERAGRRAAIERLARAEGIIALVDYVTDWLTVTLAFATAEEHAQRLAEVRAALGGIEPLTWFVQELPAVEREATRLDWRIVRALRGDAGKPVHEVAKAVGVSTKTVQRRLDALAQAGAISVFARIGAATQDELMLCSLVVKVDEARGREAMGELHGVLLADAWTRCSAPMFQDGMHYDLVAAPRSPRALADLLEAAAKVPGVVDVRGHLAARVEWAPAWLDAEMDRRIASMPVQ